MEITFTQTEALSATEPEPESRILQTRPEGILNSNYKAIVRNNFNKAESNSIFGIRQAIKSRQYQFTPSIDTILKLSVFAIVLSVVL
ncbi:MAG: hypothetical protein AAF688_07015 [Bacteroidota bacterium]